MAQKEKMMNKNVRIARELIKIAKCLAASNITKEDISKAWKTSDYLWKQFIKKHNDMNCFIEGNGTNNETYHCLSNKGNVPKVIIHKNGLYKVQGCGVDEPEFYSFAEALDYLESCL